jgi:hypothetical protein
MPKFGWPEGHRRRFMGTRTGETGYFKRKSTGLSIIMIIWGGEKIIKRLNEYFFLQKECRLRRLTHHIFPKNFSARP